MRWRCLLIVVLFAGFRGEAVAAELDAKSEAQAPLATEETRPAPDTVHTVADQIPVRSGPSLQFYVTSHIDSATPLTVYAEQDGFLAVRPPEGSHSWVLKRYLRETERPGVARVVGDQAVAWVGSDADRVLNHKWQVKLKSAERVKVLGEAELRLVEGGPLETVAKIAPPAGEFRWVSAAHVSKKNPDSSKPSDTPSETLAGTKPVEDASAGVRAAQFVQIESLSDLSEPLNSKSEPPNTGSEAKSDRWGPRGERTERDRLPNPLLASRQGESSPSSSWKSGTDSPLLPLGDGPQLVGPHYATGALGEVNLQLSVMATREPGTWDIAQLRNRTLQIIERGATPVERGRARLMLERVEQFAELKRRHLALSNDRSPAASLLAGGDAPVGTGVRGNEAAYAGTGWLMAVHSPASRTPPYALVDEQGKILQMVSPAPGLNLNRYVRQKVGIIGDKRYATTLGQPVLTAQRVVDLQRVR